MSPSQEIPGLLYEALGSGGSNAGKRLADLLEAGFKDRDNKKKFLLGRLVRHLFPPEGGPQGLLSSSERLGEAPGTRRAVQIHCSEAGWGALLKSLGLVAEGALAFAEDEADARRLINFLISQLGLQRVDATERFVLYSRLGVPGEIVEFLLEQLQEAWTSYNTAFGVTPALTFGTRTIQIWLDKLEGIRGDTWPGGPIRFNLNYLNREFPEPGGRNSIRQTVYHEMFHRIQYAFGFRRGNELPAEPFQWFSEGTAVWAEAEFTGFALAQDFRFRGAWEHPRQSLLGSNYQALPFWMFRSKMALSPVGRPDPTHIRREKMRKTLQAFLVTTTGGRVKPESETGTESEESIPPMTGAPMVALAGMKQAKFNRGFPKYVDALVRLDLNDSPVQCWPIGEVAPKPLPIDVHVTKVRLDDPLWYCSARLQPYQVHFYQVQVSKQMQLSVSIDSDDQTAFGLGVWLNRQKKAKTFKAEPKDEILVAVWRTSKFRLTTSSPPPSTLTYTLNVSKGNPKSLPAVPSLVGSRMFHDAASASWGRMDDLGNVTVIPQPRSSVQMSDVVFSFALVDKSSAPCPNPGLRATLDSVGDIESEAPGIGSTTLTTGTLSGGATTATAEPAIRPNVITAIRTIKRTAFFDEWAGRRRLVIQTVLTTGIKDASESCELRTWICHVSSQTKTDGFDSSGDSCPRDSPQNCNPDGSGLFSESQITVNETPRSGEIERLRWGSAVRVTALPGETAIRIVETFVLN